MYFIPKTSLVTEYSNGFTLNKQWGILWTSARWLASTAASQNYTKHMMRPSLGCWDKIWDRESKRQQQQQQQQPSNVPWHWRIQRGDCGGCNAALIFKKKGHQRGRCDKHGVYSEWTGTERAGQAWRWEVSPRPSGHMQLDAYHVRRGFVQKTANKVV